MLSFIVYIGDKIMKNYIFWMSTNITIQFLIVEFGGSPWVGLALCGVSSALLVTVWSVKEGK